MLPRSRRGIRHGAYGIESATSRTEFTLDNNDSDNSKDPGRVNRKANDTDQDNDAGSFPGFRKIFQCSQPRIPENCALHRLSIFQPS